jgi:hypothetical protein
MPWLSFLEQKCGGQRKVFQFRKRRIEKWVASQMFAEPPVSEEQRLTWKHEVEKLAKAIDAAWNRLKKKGL